MGKLLIIAIIGGLALFLMTSGAQLFTDISGDDIAALISLTLVGTLVMSGVVAHQCRVGTFIRQALLWAVIFIGLIVGYEYRYELRDIAERTAAGFRPDTTVSSSSSDGALSVELRRTGSSFLTRGTVNGQATNFIVDTGASTVVLTAQTAALAGIDTNALRFSVPVATANGTTNAASANVSSITIGDIERRDLRVLVAAPDTLFENLLGLTFLDTLSGYEVQGRRLILRD
ncbi:MAG: TIGR02281 family clan AA aspartic protease [Ahrensia sp.]